MTKERKPKSKRPSFKKKGFGPKSKPGKKTKEPIKKEATPIGEGEEKKGIRLNKYVSNAGVCSRRKADEHIKKGKVTVNGKVVLEMGYRVQKGEVVKYQGKKLFPEKKVYVLLNKPKNVITTTDDPEGRKTVMGLVHRAAKERLYPVGRLDRNTTGLLVLTNDGELAQKLAHPSKQIEKLYHAFLDKPLAEKHLAAIRKGLKLEDGLALVDEVDYVKGKGKEEVGIALHIGRNRIVRRIFEHLGYEVKKLDRVVYAGLTKRDLGRGRWRYLTKEELGRLHRR